MNEELLCQSLFYKESYFSFNQAFLFLTLVRSVSHISEKCFSPRREVLLIKVRSIFHLGEKLSIVSHYSCSKLQVL